MPPEILERRTPNQFDARERAYNDVTTWAAEVLDGSMRTSFEYGLNDVELYASDGGNLREVFDNAIIDAYESAATDPRLKFEISRRIEERKELDDMTEMASGLGSNTMVVVSDRPHALDHVHEDIGGYNGSRRQAMLRVITRTDEGKIRITSQSLDKSDRAGLEAIYSYFGLRPEPGELLGQRIYADVEEPDPDDLADELTRRYDRTLEQKYSQEFKAGRSPADMDDTYEFVLSQQDLLDAFVIKNDPSEENHYALAAALEARWNNRHEQNGPSAGNIRSLGLSALDEMIIASQRAMDAGKTYSGCGMSISASGQLDRLGYGVESSLSSSIGSDKYGSLKFDCPKCGYENTRQRGKLIKCCQSCSGDVTC